MARPKKEFEDLRIHQVNIRLTNVEKEYSEKQAELSGLSVANWLRKAAFSKKALTLKVSPMHREYYRQLVGISRNINQIARKYNAGHFPNIEKELYETKTLLKNINKLFLNDS